VLLTEILTGKDKVMFHMIKTERQIKTMMQTERYVESKGENSQEHTKGIERRMYLRGGVGMV